MDKMIYEFDMLWCGWELDGKGWVMERPDGNRYLSITNHGSLELMSDENGRKFLFDKIEEYRKAVENTIKAMELLDKGKQ